MSNRELQILKQRGFTLFLGLREMQPPEFLKKKKKPQNFISRLYINIWSCENESDKHAPNVP